MMLHRKALPLSPEIEGFWMQKHCKQQWHCDDIMTFESWHDLQRLCYIQICFNEVYKGTAVYIQNSVEFWPFWVLFIRVLDVHILGSTVAHGAGSSLTVLYPWARPINPCFLEDPLRHN